ncbi:MAG: nuclear transport factor 2 family protein [Opitutales bacterium]
MNPPVRSLVIAFVMASALITFCPAADKPGEKDARQEIANIIKESTAKLNRLDIEGGLKHIHPTAYTEYAHIPQKSLVGIDKKFLIGICKAIFPSLKLKIGPPMDLKVHVKGDAAYATYRSQEQLGDGPPMMVRRTEIFVREKGAWHLTHSHRSILTGE